jgi:peptidoglycan/xylan/chitin deacetylase (PgdA/CDA1 family)
VRSAAAPRLGPVVDRVRVHDDPDAADALGAAAFTIGTDIHVGRGLSSRGDHDDRKLRTLLHEAVHAAQQGGASGPPSLHPKPSSGPEEREARDVAASMRFGGLRPEYGRVSGAVGPGPSTGVRPSGPTLTLGQAAPQLVELTYDDGPDSAGNTKKTLDHLNKAGARATFYLVGQRVAEGDNWRVVFDIAASGHWIGNHAFDWNNATDNHIFLHGSVSERAAKILKTEFAIRDALIKGKADAQANKTWTGIPQAYRDSIDDLIASGTGRFRTPGFRSKWWKADGQATARAIEVASEILESAGLRRFSTSDAVSIDPKDWESGRTQADVEKAVTGDLSSDKDTILLHSRLGISADATPAILAEIKKRGFAYQAPAQGAKSSVSGPGFAGVQTSTDWVDRFQSQVLPLGPAVTTNVTDPIDRTVTRQVGLVWAQLSDGSSYLTQVSLENSSIARSSQILFRTFVDADLKDAATRRALPNQAKGIQTLPAQYIQGIPASAPSTTAKK